MGSHAPASVLVPVWWFYSALRLGRWCVRDARKALRESIHAIVNAAEEVGATRVCVPRNLLTPSPPAWGVATVVMVTREVLRPHVRAETLAKLSRSLPPLPGVQVLLAPENQLHIYSRVLGPLKCFDTKEARHVFIP